MAVFSLQGAGVAPGGLRGRLLQVVTEATNGLGFEPRVQFEGAIETMDVHIADHLVPVVREALSTLTVSDDGIGTPPEVLGGRRLSNMAARGPRPRRRLHHHPPTVGRFPPHLAGATTVTTAGVTPSGGDGARSPR